MPQGLQAQSHEVGVPGQGAEPQLIQLPPSTFSVCATM